MFKQMISFLLICIGTFQLPLIGQPETRFVMGAAGETDRNEFMSLEWTLGELAIDVYDGADVHFAEGFHQPGERSAVSTEENENPATTGWNEVKDTNPSFTCYPNPVSTTLTVSLSNPSAENQMLFVSHTQGSLIRHESVAKDVESFQMDFSSLPAGLYVLTVVNAGGQVTGSQKITKN